MFYRRFPFLAVLVASALSSVNFRQGSAQEISKIKIGDRQNWKTDQRLANRRGSYRRK